MLSTVRGFVNSCGSTSDLWNSVSTSCQSLCSYLKGRSYVLLNQQNRLLANSSKKAEPYVTSLRQALAPLGKEAPLLCGSLTALSVITDRFFYAVFEKTPFIKSSNTLKTSARLLVDFFVLKSVVRLTALPMNNVGVAAVVVVAMAINAVWNHLQKLQDTLKTQSQELNGVKQLILGESDVLSEGVLVASLRQTVIEIKESLTETRDRLEAVQTETRDRLEAVQTENNRNVQDLRDQSNDFEDQLNQKQKTEKGFSKLFFDFSLIIRGLDLFSKGIAADLERLTLSNNQSIQSVRSELSDLVEKYNFYVEENKKFIQKLEKLEKLESNAERMTEDILKNNQESINLLNKVQEFELAIKSIAEQFRVSELIGEILSELYDKNKTIIVTSNEDILTINKTLAGKRNKANREKELRIKNELIKKCQIEKSLLETIRKAINGKSSPAEDPLILPSSKSLSDFSSSNSTSSSTSS